MRALRRSLAAVVLLSGLAQSWLAGAAACRPSFDYAKAFTDAQTVYDQSSGLKVLGDAAQNPNPTYRQVKDAIDGLAPGIFRKYGIQIQWVPDNADIPGMGGRQGWYSPDPSATGRGNDIIYLREGLARTPSLLLKTFTHEYGRALLGKYYMQQYIAEAAASGRPLTAGEINTLALNTHNGVDLIPYGPNLPNGGRVGVTGMLDYVVQHQGLDPSGYGPGQAPPPPPPRQPPPPAWQTDPLFGEAVTSLRNATNLSHLNVLYENASRQFPVGEEAAQLAKVYDAAAGRLAAEPLLSASNVADLKSAYWSARGALPSGDTAQVAAAFEQRGNQLLEPQVQAMKDATDYSALKKAYRTAAREFHPDAMGGQANGVTPVDQATLDYLNQVQKRLNSLYEDLQRIHKWGKYANG